MFIRPCCHFVGARKATLNSSLLILVLVFKTDLEYLNCKIEQTLKSSFARTKPLTESCSVPILLAKCYSAHVLILQVLAWPAPNVLIKSFDKLAEESCSGKQISTASCDGMGDGTPRSRAFQIDAETQTPFACK